MQSGKEVKIEYSERLFKLFYMTKYDVIGWSLVSSLDSPMCRLVNILRKRPDVVSLIRPIVMEYDPALIRDIRYCQDQAKKNEK